MRKSRVIFMLKNSKGGEWQIQAFCPGGVIEYIVGFKTDDEASDWINGPQSKEWANAHGHSDAGL
jgi:hypothetical protein